RSHIRPDEKLTYYFCADYDLSFLEMPVERIDAFEITPEAGDAAQQTRYAIQEAFRQLIEGGENVRKITQEKVAELTNLTQGYISQVAKGFGGWKTLKKILVFLLSNSYSASNNSEPLTEHELWMAQEYLPKTSEDLPENAVQQVVELAETTEPSRFQEILRATPFEYRAKLIRLAIQVLPKEVREEFHILAEESLNFT
ncbi:MAG: DNA primase, partial [Cyanobacteriota bacterium]